MDFPTLKFPKPHGKLEARTRYELGLLDPDGFAATYFETLKRAEEEVSTGYSYQKSEDGWWRADANEEKESYCTRINEEHKKIRKKIDRKMQDYLLSHDGRIDFWPDSSGFYVLSAENDKFYFHYFGSSYESSYLRYSDSVHRCEPGLEYQNEYVSAMNSGSSKYGADDKKKRMREKADKEKEMIEYCRKSFIMKSIGGVFLLFVMALALADIFFALGGPVASLLNAFRETDAGGNPHLVFCIGCLVLAVAVGWNCVAAYSYYRDFKNSSAESEQAYQEYIAGPYERELKAEKERESKKTEARKRDIELAREWHRAWFEWAKQVGDSPKDAE